MRRGLTPTVIVAALTAVVGLALLVWGASNGSPLVAPPSSTWDSPAITLPQGEQVDAALETGADDDASPPEEASDLSQRLVDLVQLGIILAVLYGMLVLLRNLLDNRGDRRTDLPSPHEDELVALLEASSDEVRYRALTEGDPRNAVVACWVALEEAAHRSGLREDRSRTAAELTTSVLSRWQVDPQAITTLSEAYREARFSRHEVTEAQRAAAVDALETIHGDLLRRLRVEQGIDAPTPSPGPERS
ncbi:DUF4129 domain-containing protein [Ornithinimicrobium flavum]|uniref:DUF4129 domain-containing protein n=1 Tax=Ornithinimicrobium flavum TaxID=1288636 RepID=UPI00106F63F8|nr:DUF4129 domain-containing protein [Ornithinimicrobium flavum]